MDGHVGIIRSIDELGRVVIPKEIRSSLDLGHGDRVAIKATENQVVLEIVEAKKCPHCGQEI